MSDQKKFSRGAIVVALCLVLVAVFATLVPPLSKSFPTEGFNEGTVRVYPSPAVKWSHSHGHAIAYVILALTFVGCFGASQDWHEAGVKYNSNTNRTWLAFLMCFGPVVISVIIFFAGYSASLDQGSKIITIDQYHQLKDAGQLSSLFK